MKCVSGFIVGKDIDGGGSRRKGYRVGLLGPEFVTEHECDFFSHTQTGMLDDPEGTTRSTPVSLQNDFWDDQIQIN